MKILKHIKSLSLFVLLLFFTACNSLAIVDGESFENVTITTETTGDVNASTFATNDFFISASAEDIGGSILNRKFGRNPIVSTSIVPVTTSGTYPTPTTAQPLRIFSSSNIDSTASTGAWTVSVQGMNGSWDEITELVNLSGTTPVTLTNTFTRVYRMKIIASGRYANSLVSSQEGEITLEHDTTGDDWAVIDVVNGGFGVGQSQISAYTVPKCYDAHILGKHVSVESNQPVNVYFFQRQNVNKTSAPYDTMRLVEQEDGLEGQFVLLPRAPIEVFPSMTDIGFMAEKTGGAGSSSVSAEWEMLLVDDGTCN